MKRRSTAGAARPTLTDSSDHLVRAVLWSCIYHRLFGPPSGGTTMITGLDPVSQEEICDILERIGNGTRSLRHDYLVRSCCSQLLAAGYRPPADDDALFYRLARGVTCTQRKGRKERIEQPEIRRYLRLHAQEHFGVPYQPFTPPARLEDEIDRRQRLSPRTVIGRPSEVAYDGTAFTISKEMLVEQPLTKVAPLINPENWTRLGPFFRETRRDDPPRRWQRGKPIAWDGRLYEEFTINWNAFTVNSFVSRIQVDYTVTADAARTDYALMYEEDDQLVVDDGYVEASRVPGYPEWTRYRGTKSLRFASSFLNMLAPAIASMFLETQAGFLESAVVELETDRTTRRTGRPTPRPN